MIYSTIQSFLTSFCGISDRISSICSLCAPRCSQISGKSSMPYLMTDFLITSSDCSGERNKTMISGLIPLSISGRIGKPRIEAPASFGCIGTNRHPLSYKSCIARCAGFSDFSPQPKMCIELDSRMDLVIHSVSWLMDKLTIQWL